MTQERDPETLAELSGLTAERATELLPLLMARDVSLERTPEDGSSPAYHLASDSRSPEEEACGADERDQFHAALEQVVAELSPRERGIVRQRWLTDEPKTLEQLGIDFGVSKERVRQLEERAKKRMRVRIQQIVGEPLTHSA
jgi:RNA polymerase sigma-32 factor